MSVNGDACKTHGGSQSEASEHGSKYSCATCLRSFDPKVGVDAGPSWDWTTKFWELAYDGAVRDIKHNKEGGEVNIEII